MRGLRTNWLLAALALWMTVGCGGGVDQYPEPVPVRGKVTFDGQPVAGAYLMFRPEGGTKGGRGAAVSPTKTASTNYARLTVGWALRWATIGWSLTIR